MRIQRKKVWTLVLLSALLIIAICVFAGCTTTQTTSSNSSQPTAQQPEQSSPVQQPAQSNPVEQSPAPNTTPSPVPNEVKAEISVPLLDNPDFEMDHFGWSSQEGTIGTENNGNKYMMAGYTWGLYQFLQVKPGETYQIYCKAKQGVGTASPARLSLIFYDSGHNIMPESKSFYYTPGAEWSSFPKNSFKVPDNALFTKLFLLSHGKGTVCFDDIEITPAPSNKAK